MVSTNPDSEENRVNRFENVNRISKVVRLKPYERPYRGIKNLSTVINEDLWITTDLHCYEGNEAENENIDNINRNVGLNRHLLILGDIGHSKKATYSHVKNAMMRINTPNKYLILGNHDIYPIQSYVDMGFKFVSDQYIFTFGNIKIWFTHTPIELRSPTAINIHGHIHGSNDYWVCDAKNHYDAYIEWSPLYVDRQMVDIPIRDKRPALQQLGRILNHLNEGAIKNGRTN